MRSLAALAAAASEPPSATKVWLVLGSIAIVAAFYFAVGRLARKRVERRLRTLVRDHPEHASDLDAALQDLQVHRSLRSCYRDEVLAQKLAPRPKLVADRGALPFLLAFVTVLVAALAIQAAVGGALAGWLALAGLLVVVAYGLWLLAPAAGPKRGNHGD